MNLFLLLTNGKHKGLPIPVRGDLLMIGADPVCQVQSRVAHMGRQHCAVVTRQGKFFVRDLASGEATILNQATVPPSQEWPLHAKDRLQVGPHDFVVQFQELGLSQRDMEEWALKTLDENAENEEPLIKNADEIQRILSQRSYNTAQKASNILRGLDPERGVNKGRLRVNIEDAVTTVRFNDVFLVEEAEIALVKQELYEFLEPNNLRVLLDYKNVAKMSSAAASMVLELYHWLRSKRSELALCRIRPELRSIFFTLNIRDVKYFNDKKEALNNPWQSNPDLGQPEAGYSLMAENLLDLGAAGGDFDMDISDLDEEPPAAEAPPEDEAPVWDSLALDTALPTAPEEQGGADPATDSPAESASGAASSPRGSALTAATYDILTGLEAKRLPEAIRLAIARFGPHINFDLDADDPTQAHGIEAEISIGTMEMMQSLAGSTTLSEAAARLQRKTMRGKRISKKREARLKARGQFVIYCPNGHLILVRESHRGRLGHCPDCREPFLVPTATVVEMSGMVDAGAKRRAAEGAAEPEAPVEHWLRDIHLHRVNPEKLKLVPGSLLKDYETIDIGFFRNLMVLTILYTGKGLFRTFFEKGAKTANRQIVTDHVAEGLPWEELKKPAHVEFQPEQIASLKVVEPSPPGEESPFINVPVFGPNRIGMRLPSPEGTREKLYVSFLLSQFREFSQLMSDVYGIGGFGENLGIPLTDTAATHRCHYSNAEIQALENLDWYRADPSFKIVISGRQCAGCKMIVSEDSRKKEKIGPKGAKVLIKAKCPKCKAPFGSNVFYGFKVNSPFPISNR